MRNLHQLLASLSVTALLSTAAAAQATWDGELNTDWNTSLNWTPNVVPGAGVDVVVPAAPSNQPTISSNHATCGDLTVDAGALLTVTGSFDLDVTGDLTIDGTLVVGQSTSDVTVVGGWTNNGTFTNGNGEVELTGNGTLGGSSTTVFQNLLVSGGTRTVTSAFGVDGDLSVEGTATLALGASDVTVAGNWISNDAGVSVTGTTGTIVFTASGLLTSGSNTVPNVRVTGGIRTVNPSAVAGDLELISGQIQIQDNVTLSVGGNANLTGGTLGWTSNPGGLETLDVDGDVTCFATAGTTNAAVRFRCGGDWQSSGAFVMAAGTVELDGGSTATISGTSVTFPLLRIVSGTKNLTADIAISDDLTIDTGATLAGTTAVVSVQDAVSLGGGGAAWNLGSATHFVGGNWSSAGGSATGAGTIDFNGPGNFSTGAGSIANVHISAGARACSTAVVLGDLSLAAPGSLDMLDDQVLTVGGNLELVSGTLNFEPVAMGFVEILDVAGDATVTATAGTFSSNSLISCAGNWSSTSAFSPSAGKVQLDGGSAASLGGASPTFAVLQIVSGTKTVNSPTSVNGNLVVDAGAALSTPGAMTIAGDVSLGGATASWNMNAATHTVMGNYLSLGANSIGTGRVRFEGTGTVTSIAPASMANVEVAAGTRTFFGNGITFGNTIAGELSMTGGAIVLDDNAIVRVNGEANLTAGTLTYNDTTAGLEILDIAGDMTLTATAGTMNANSFINCGGNWNSSAAWLPSAGTIQLDGPGTTTVSGVGLFNVSVNAGTKQVTAASALQGGLNIASGATLETSAALSVGTNVTLGDATSAWILGSSTHTVTGSWSSGGGSATGAGAIEFVGAGQLLTGPGGSISNVTVSGGTRNVFDSQVGTLTVAASSPDGLTIQNDQTLTVAGDALLTSGTLSFSGAGGATEDLDIGGNAVVSLTAGTMNANSRILCAGDWTSTAAFAPTGGVVVLGGGTSTSIQGAGIDLARLEIASGAKTLVAANPLSVDDLDLASGASLTANSPLTVTGDFTLGDGTATFDMGAVVHVVFGDYISAGCDGSGIGSSGMDFQGNGVLDTGGGSISNVQVSAGTRSATGIVDVTGDLNLVGGTLSILDDTLLTVGGNADFGAAGVLAFTPTVNAMTDVIDVAGDVNADAAAGTFSTASRIFCAGNWSSSSSFMPATGTVVLDGLLATTVSGAGVTLAALQVNGTGTKTLMTDVLLQGSCTLGAGASLDLGTNTLTVDGGNFDSSAAGATVSSALGQILLDGLGTFRTGANTVSVVDVIGGTRSVFDSVISTSFSMSGAGATTVIRDNQTLTVNGDLLLGAGTLSFNDITAGLETIDVSGTATIQSAAGAMTANTRITAAGDWISDSTWIPTAGVVQLDGGTTTTVTGSTPTFFDLDIVSGTKQVNAAASIVGGLEVLSGATLDTTAPLTVGTGVVLGDNTALWTLGSSTHLVGGPWNSTGGSATGAGTIQFVSNGVLLTGVGSISNVSVTGGVRNVLGSTISGNLTMAATSPSGITIQNDATLAVGGNVDLVSGTLAFSGSTGIDETLDVAGDFSSTATAGAFGAQSVIACAGNWSSSPAFAPSAGTVILDGGTSTTIAGGGNLADLRIASGQKSLLAASDMSVANLEVVSGAALVTASSLTVDGDVTLGDSTAAWDLGSSTHSVSDNWVSTGASATGTGAIDFDGFGSLDVGVAGGGSISNVVFSHPFGVRSVVDCAITGNLTMNSTAGQFHILDNRTVTVGGDVALNTGSISFLGTTAGDELLDVEGDMVCTVAAGTVTASTLVECAGDWSSSSAFAPGAGTFVLDGAGTTTITGLGGGATPTFHDLVVRGGVRTAANTLTLDVSTLTIESGATLEVDDVSVTIPGTAVSVAGTLAVESAGTLALGGGVNMLVPSGGTLRVVGDASDEAAVVGAAGGGYLITVEGTLEAGFFRFAEMSEFGIIVPNARAIGAFPNDLRNGVFSNPSAVAGSTMLDLRRDVPTEFSFVDFEDPLAVGTYNVRTFTGAPITFVNSSGSLSGEDFDHDPFNLVAWAEAVTEVSGFTATAGPGMVTLDWTSTVEAQLDEFVIERGTSVSGPFAEVGTAPAAGPGAYQFVDPVAPDILYFYNLVERKLSSAETLLATGSAMPWTASFAANMLTVGPSGTFADIQSAINAATPGKPVILVEAGTYPAFSIFGGKGAVRVFADGSGPVIIDTTTGPVTIAGIPFGEIVELSDMEIGTPGSPNGGILVAASAGTVSLDDLIVEGGVGQAGIRVAGSTSTAIYRSTVNGTPGLQVTNSSTVAAGNLTLSDADVTVTSRLTHTAIGVVPTVEVGSTEVAFAGVMPDLEIEEFQHLGVPFQIGLTAKPSTFTQFGFGTSMLYIDLNDPILWQMPSMLSGTSFVLLSQFTNPAGEATLFFSLPKESTFVGFPIPFEFWTVELAPVSLRFSNPATVVGLP